MKCAIWFVIRETFALSAAKVQLQTSFAALGALFDVFLPKLIETNGSLIEHLLSKNIHEVTAHVCELKVTLFILTCSLNYLVRAQPGIGRQALIA